MRSGMQTAEPAVIILPEQKTHGNNGKRWHPQKPRLLTVLFSILVLLAAVHFIAVAHQADLVVIPTTCTSLLRTTDYTAIVHLQPKTQEMGAVQFVNQLVGGQPAALVSVAHDDSQHSLDAYIFGCTIHQHAPHLVSLFTQRDLPQGTISLSAANTLVLGQLDTNLSAQAAIMVQPLQQNIYREYSWVHGAFVQLIFPSFYPVTSRSEAETLQQQANSGQSLPWSDPLTTAEQMAKDLFKWPSSSLQDSVIRKNDTTAQVQLVQQNPTLQMTVMLQRLVQPNASGLWFVTAASSSGIALSQPQNGNTITSPTVLKGNGGLADGQTTVTLFDHTLTPLSQLNNPTLNVDTGGLITGTTFYTNNAHDQQGLLLIQSLPPAGSSETGQLLLLKVLLG